MPRSNARALDAVADVAAAQRGLVTAAQLAEIGLADASIRHRSRQGGPWERVLPAVYLVSGGALTSEQRRTAAALYVGQPYAFTGSTAARAHGLRALDRVAEDEVHVLIPNSRKRASNAFVVVERTAKWPVAETIGGDLVVPVARAAIDATRRMSSRPLVRALLAEVVQAGHASTAELHTELSRGQRRRTALAREVVKALERGPASGPELDLFDRWNAAGLPHALWNSDLYTPDGRFLARPDVYLPSWGVVFEVDSLAFHYARPDWEATMERHTRMTARGLLVLHATPARIRASWDEVQREVRRDQLTRGRGAAGSRRRTH